MLNKHGQVGVSSYEGQFGPIQDEFPLHTGRPRRSVRVAEHIFMDHSDPVPPEDTEPPAADSEGDVVYVSEPERPMPPGFELEFIGGVATASMVPANTRLL